MAFDWEETSSPLTLSKNTCSASANKTSVAIFDARLATANYGFLFFRTLASLSFGFTTAVSPFIRVSVNIIVRPKQCNISTLCTGSCRVGLTCYKRGVCGRYFEWSTRRANAVVTITANSQENDSRSRIAKSRNLPSCYRGSSRVGDKVVGTRPATISAIYIW